jgi:DNA ligase-4
VKDLELVYVAFDVLYDEDRSVIDRTLRERHEILRNAFKPVRECDDVVQGDGGVFLGPAPTSRGVVRGRIILNVPAASGDPPNPDCFVGASLRDVEDALWARIERQEEGLVLKDLESRWVPGERDKKWVKLKPDYLPTEDLDVVVVGGFKGTGALRGGKIAEYLVGIVEAPRRRGDGDEDGDGDDAFGDDGIRDVGDANSPPPLPSRVLTFSKVGTGMSARVMERLRTRLGPHMLPATRGARRGAPLAYATTGAAGETPDVWIDSPENSVVLTVKADVRLVKTATFASDFSLRFPRVTGVRWDKPWHECLSDAELERRAREDGGIAVARGDGDGEVNFRFGSKRKNQPTRDERDERDERRDAQKSLPAHLARADVRHVAKRDDALKTLDVFFITAGAGFGADESKRAAALKLELAGLLQSRGGTHSEARHFGNTHVVATKEASTSVRFEAATRLSSGGVDVLTPEWLRACVEAGRVIEPRPKHRLFLSQTTVDAAQGRLDVFGDAHDEDVDAEDVLALLESDRVARAAAAAAARREAPDDAARDAAEGDGGEIAAAFRGYTFAILLAPSPSGSGLDDDDFASPRSRARVCSRVSRIFATRRRRRRRSGLFSIRRARAKAKARRRSALARRDVADDPETHLPSRFGEAARVAATLAVSLRLRGASVWRKGRKGRKGDDENENEDEDATHVLVVTPDGFTRAPASRSGRPDGAAFGVGRDALWVNAAWVRARIDAYHTVGS